MFLTIASIRTWRKGKRVYVKLLEENEKMTNSLLEILLTLFIYYLVHSQSALLPNFVALLIAFITIVCYTNAEDKPEMVVFLVFIVVTILMPPLSNSENFALIVTGC